MKSPIILIPVPRADYRVFAAAARAVRKECGRNTPDAIALIQFQLVHRTPEGIAKDYLDCVCDAAARRRVQLKRVRIQRVTEFGGRL